MNHEHTIDIKDMCCSAPIIRLTKEFKMFASGDVVLVISNKSSMVNDIPAYCGMTQHELLDQTELDGLYQFWIKKK